MEKQNPKGLPVKMRPGGTEEASHDLQPRGIGERPERGEAERENHFAAHAQRWDVQWQNFLERVKSPELLEEDELCHEAKLLLVSYEQEMQAFRGSEKEWAKIHVEEQALPILPLDLQCWLWERGPKIWTHAVALAKAFSWRDSGRPRKQVAAESSSSAVQENPSNLGLEENMDLSSLGPVLDSERERDLPGMWEGDEGETIWNSESPSGQEGNTTEENIDNSIPSLGRAIQEQEKETGNQSLGAPYSSRPEGKLNSQDTIYGHGIVSTEIKTFICEECGERFARSNILILHQMTHTRVKLHKCPLCIKSFPQESRLRKHLRIHAGLKPFKCSECGRKFRHKEFLERHGHIHTRENRFKCPSCEKSFKYKSSLIFHQRIHTGEKPYQCSKCGESFARYLTLKEHEGTHVEQGETVPSCSKP